MHFVKLQKTKDEWRSGKLVYEEILKSEGESMQEYMVLCSYTFDYPDGL